MVQSFYLWMAKHEHLKQMELEYRNLGLDTTNLEEEIREIENDNNTQNIEEEW